MGAARCRHKKQLRKEAGERAVQATTQQTDTAANPPRTEEGSPSRAGKHSRSHPSTPSPSGAQQTKKPTVPEQRTYAQAASDIIRVAIVLMAYPDRKFTDKEVILLKRLVKGRILDLVKGTKAPIFQGTSDRDSAVIFNCTDVETVEGLKSLTTVLTIKEGLQLVDRLLKIGPLVKYPLAASQYAFRGAGVPRRATPPLEQGGETAIGERICHCGISGY